MKMMAIEELLTWAFVEELPKVERLTHGPVHVPSSWSGFSEMIALGTVVDRSPNAYGVLSSYIDDGPPHPDALVVGDAVKALAGRGFDVADGWMPFPEWQDEHGVIFPEVRRVVAMELARGDRLNGAGVVALVTRCALMARGPDWRASQPKVGMVCHRGKPAWFVRRKAKDRLGQVVEFEDNGYDAQRGRPVKGAYRKWTMTDRIDAAVCGRLDWQVWRSALGVLHDDLAGRLVSRDLLPFVADRTPWYRAESLGPVSKCL